MLGAMATVAVAEDLVAHRPPPLDRPITDTERARALGLSLTGLARLRSLVAERGRNSWDVGVVLVIVYGAPPPPG